MTKRFGLLLSAASRGSRVMIAASTNFLRNIFRRRPTLSDASALTIKMYQHVYSEFYYPEGIPESLKKYSVEVPVRLDLLSQDSAADSSGELADFPEERVQARGDESDQINPAGRSESLGRESGSSANASPVSDSQTFRRETIPRFGY